MILPVKFSGVSSNLNSKRLTSSLSCNVLNPGEDILAVDSVKVSVFRRWFEPSQSILPCIVRLGVLVYLTKTKYRIRKDVDLRVLKIHNSFVTNQWQVSPWMIFPPTNCFQSRDLILLRHQSCRLCRTFVWVWDLLCLRWTDNCFGNSFPWIPLIPLSQP